MALNWTAIDTAIKAWLDAYVSGVTWVRGNQNLPTLVHPFGVYTWTSIGAKPPAQGELPDDQHQASTTDAQVFRHRRHQLSLNVYSASVVGTTAAVYAQQARDSIELEAVRVDLEAAGLVVVPQGAVIDLTQLLPDRAESRALLEVVVYTVDTATQTVGSIATAEITPTLVT